MCRPLNKSVVEGYILFIIQITQLLAATQPCLELKSLLCSHPSECHITVGGSRGHRGLGVGSCGSSAFLTTFDMPLQSLLSQDHWQTLQEREPRVQIACDSLQPLSVTAVP